MSPLTSLSRISPDPLSRSSFDRKPSISWLPDPLRAHRSIGWNCDVVIDRNIAQVHIINVDAVAALPNGWILLEFTDIALPISFEPPVAHMNLPVHRHSSCRTAADSNVPRTREHLEINRPANLKCSLE